LNFVAVILSKYSTSNIGTRLGKEKILHNVINSICVY